MQPVVYINQASNAYDHAQNGAAECAIRWLLECIRKCLLDTNLSLKYGWRHYIIVFSTTTARRVMLTLNATHRLKCVRACHQISRHYTCVAENTTYMSKNTTDRISYLGVGNSECS